MDPRGPGCKPVPRSILHQSHQAMSHESGVHVLDKWDHPLTHPNVSLLIKGLIVSDGVWSSLKCGWGESSIRLS